MRYTYYFENDITNESVQELIDILVQVESIDLFITTEGGSAWAIRVLIHALNQHPDVNIYLTGYISSAGTFLLTDCDHPVYLTEELDWILFHQGDRFGGGEFRKSDLDRAELYNQLKDFNNNLADKYKKLGLTTKEIKRFNEGYDIILYRKDFSRLKIARK